MYENTDKFKRVFSANTHDDCADVLTSIAEALTKPKTTVTSREV